MGLSYRIVALERLKVVQAIQRSGIADPLERLPTGHQPDIVLLQDFIQEMDETFFIVFIHEPGRVIVQRERRPMTVH